MQEDMIRFRKKLIVQLLNSNLNKIDINKPLSEEDDHDDANNDPMNIRLQATYISKE
jgi:hypothetical protein